MSTFKNTIITGTGSYLPSKRIGNTEFLDHEFYNDKGVKIDSTNDIIIQKFKKITGIDERRYALANQMTSDIASIAAKRAVEAAGIDKEELDQIIVAHNFGNTPIWTKQTDILPCLAARVKHFLKIENPDCVAYDILFGCPGWIQAFIQAEMYIRLGEAKKCLVIGAETLSRVVDPHDRDTMIFADGAGAAVVEGIDEDQKRGVLSHATRSYTKEEAYFLYSGRSNDPAQNRSDLYIKMQGRKIYELALNEVPKAMKICLEKSNCPIGDVKKIFIHQANEKMDEAIIHRFYKLFDKAAPEMVMPMSIHMLGNSSVATIPTLYDLVVKHNYQGHEIHPGDLILFASIGAGMHINAISYRA